MRNTWSDLSRTAPAGAAQWRGAWLAAVWVFAAGCAPTGIKEARSALRTNDLGTARALLEQDRERRPRSIEVRIALGEVYYRSARDAIDWDGDEGRYLAFLEKSVHEFLTAAKLDPEDPTTHFYLAVMDIYRGDVHAALRGFQNARRLRPGPVADTNIAEVYVYLGNLAAAKRWNQGGSLSGTGPATVTFNQMLIDWSEGRLDGARRSFEILRARHPETIRTINAAPLPMTPRTFEQFAGYCCASPGCGPHMESACADLKLPVTRREVSEETLLQELRLEMEAQRRLGEIYRQRKELSIEVESPIE